MIKRYCVVPSARGPRYMPDQIESPLGPWVKFEDHVADKRELVEALEMLVKNPYQNDVGKWVAAQEKATALIAKHKEGV